ncbi:acyl carrier protein [Deinococcus cellulosilyticus]|uniref:Carrier domain-containing protein n=1 Tax=Deinococcus cellulosilyticus (strain DSM 18568 / NBRC 106333 / KACC 11606 / 5516J-15) TaxID=1223518 RepID=A0A511N3Z4_DEIC1|nr:acyl carrier protein [Deinococcus cellulosilyticus]GEM47599.1 hypothetical protein DC3_32340 [Deinococcus cellulosilyticus NBRC 106333 = KACC 11606]
MNKNEFFALLEEILETEPGSLKDDTDLQSVGWDSLADVSFIAAVDNKFGMTLDPNQLSKSQTVQDLLNLVGDKVGS